jgi:hypothetical protein
MSPQPDYSMGWILEYVRESFQGRSPYSEITFEEYIERLWQTLEKAGVPGILKKKQAGYDGTYYAVADAPDQIRQSALQAINYLLARELLVSIPDTSISPWRGKHNSYILTKSGAEWATGKDPVPEDSARYMALLKELVKALDPVIEQYVSEGLSSFVKANYFAAAVMIGAASEKEVYLLGDAMMISLKDHKKKNELRNLLDARSMNKLFKFLEGQITAPATKKIIPYKVMEGADTHLMSLIEIHKSPKKRCSPPSKCYSDRRFCTTVLPSLSTCSGENRGSSRLAIKESHDDLILAPSSSSRPDAFFLATRFANS